MTNPTNPTNTADLRAAAQAVVDRWDTPTWKDVPATAEYINRLRAALAAPAPDMTDAYAGAREDLSIWKKRALEAEALNRKFAASVNSPSFMGEPAAPAQAGEYPELPIRYATYDAWGNQTKHGYNAKDMHAYVDADRAARGAAQSAPVDAAVQQDAERYRWLREYAIGAYTSVFRGKSSAAVYLLTRVPALDGIGEETDTAIDAARATQEGKHD